jgi:hypothetical protein
MIFHIAKQLMFDLFLLFLFVLVVAAIAAHLRTQHLQTTAEQKLFSSGKIPETLPDGLYHGSADNYSGSWQGKKFDREKSTGINVFKKGDETHDQYAFKTSVGKGVKDDISVIKIDYNIPENPWYLRFVLDEIVETEKDTYLGKLNLQLPFGIHFTLAFFSLKK